MKSKGIRILDIEGHVVCVTIFDILEEVREGNLFHWTILFLDGTPMPGHGKFLKEYEKQVNKSENGLRITWEELNLLSQKYHQIIDMILIGSKDVNLLHRYGIDQEMYETCDFVIEMFDTSFWEVFSKNEELINRFAVKSKDTKFLAPDFKK